MDLTTFVAVTFGGAVNADGSSLSNSQLGEIAKFLEGKGSGVTSSSSFADFLTNTLTINPAVLPSGTQYVLYSGGNNFALANNYVYQSKGVAGTIGETPYGEYLSEAPGLIDISNMAEELDAFLLSQGITLAINASNATTFTAADSLLDVCFNYASPIFTTNAINSGIPIQGFVYEASATRGFAQFELPIVVAAPPTTIFNGSPTTVFAGISAEETLAKASSLSNYVYDASTDNFILKSNSLAGDSVFNSEQLLGSAPKLPQVLTSSVEAAVDSPTLAILGQTLADVPASPGLFTGIIGKAIPLLGEAVIAADIGDSFGTAFLQFESGDTEAAVTTIYQLAGRIASGPIELATSALFSFPFGAPLNVAGHNLPAIILSGVVSESEKAGQAAANAILVAGKKALTYLESVMGAANGDTYNDPATALHYASLGNVVAENSNGMTQTVDLSAVTAIDANGNFVIPGVHFVSSGETYNSIASSLNIPGVSATVLAEMNGESKTAVTPSQTVINIPTSAKGIVNTQQYLLNDNPNGNIVIDLDGNLIINTGANPVDGQHGSITVIPTGGNTIDRFNQVDVANFSQQNGLGVVNLSGSNFNGEITFNADGTAVYGQGPATLSFQSGAHVTVYGHTLQATTYNGSLGGIGTNYELGAGGAFYSEGASYVAPITGATVGQDQSATAADETALKAVVPTDAVSSQSISNQDFVASVASGPTPSETGGLAADTLAGGQVAGGMLLNDGGITITTGENAAGTGSIANTGGLVASSLSGVIDGYTRPGNQQDQPTADIVGDLVAGQITGGTLATSAPAPLQLRPISTAAVNTVLANYAAAAPNLVDIDPLLIDLTGNGVQVNNWLGNQVYFDTNLNSAGTAADGMEHHTSWMASGTGMLVFDPNNTAVTNITQTISEFLNTGSGVGNFRDGLTALASLATAGATAFTSATAKIDPTTGKSYWNEIEIAQGNPSSSGAIAPSQLETLATAGITGISLLGGGNKAESLNGSAVTNRATYSSAAGSTTATGQVASIDFATDTTGDIATTAAGGIIINSTPEGGVGSSNSFIDQGTSASSFTLINGVLSKAGAVVATGLVGAFATTQNDSITVSVTDTSAYWLGGGAGAATLTGGAGNTMFLINSQTMVHGGTGFNIAQVTDGNPITVDLKTDNLQEVIGGTGPGTFNASGTTWNVFIQGGSGNNIIIGGYADSALSGGSGDDLIEGGPGGSVIHAGSGNDVIYGGSGATKGAPNSDIIYGGAGSDVVALGTNNSAVFAGSGSMTLIGNDTQTVAATGAKAFSVVTFHGSYANYTLTHNADGSTTVTDKVAGQDGPVTLENVTDISFSDVSMVPLNTTGVMPANDTVVVSGSGPYVIQASTLLANEIDYAGNTLSIASLLDNNGVTIARGASGQVNGGTAALSADGSQVTFTPKAGFTGLPSFRYYDKDNLGNTDINVGLSLNNSATGNNALMNATVTLVTPTEPTDPGFTSEWYLQAADVLSAWSAGFTGAGVSVGVFDPSGNVDFTNPDLTANAGGSYLDTGAPGTDQTGAHATLVAGVIGAANDGEGDVGVAYNATISSEAITTGTDTTDIVSGVLADWSNYAVVNNSWYAPQPFADNFDSDHNNKQFFDNAVQNGRNGLGTIIVFCAGNTRTTGGNTNNGSDTANPDEITVGGINATSDLGSLQFSGAPFSSPGASILVSAPANNILTTGVALTNEFGQQAGGTSEITLGTSLAAPIVSGVAAMMLQANPGLGYRDVQQILADTATLVPSNTAAPTTWFYNGATNWNGGGMHVSNDYGFGEVDAGAAVRLAQTWTNVSASYNYQLVPYTPNSPLSQPQSYSITVPSAGAPEIQDFQVEVRLWDATPGDLTITLTSPTGLVSILMNQPQNAAMTGTATTTDGVVHPVFEATFDTVQDLGASFAGTWTVSITGSKGASEPGTLQMLSFIPEQITPTNMHIYTDEFGSLSADPNNAARSTLTDTGTGVTLNASAVSTGMTLDLRSGSTDSVIAGRALTVAANTTVTTVDGGAGNDTITANDAGDTIVAGGGSDTINGGAGNDSISVSSGNDTLDGGRGVNTASFASTDTLPDQSWSFSESASGSIVVSGASAGYMGSATLIRIQVLRIGGANYDLASTPIAGGTTNIGTPTDGAAGVVATDGAGNDTLTFSNTGTSYWHMGGGTDTATLAAGTTDIYMQGSVGQYHATSSNGMLTLVDQVTNRNGTKNIVTGAGTGNIVFSDGSTISVFGQSSKISADSTLDVQAAIGTITFAGAAATLILHPASTSNMGMTVQLGVSGMAIGDTIDLAGAMVTSTTYTQGNGSGTLAVLSGANQIATFTVSGTHAASQFVHHTDAAGTGSDIVLSVAPEDFNGDGKSDVVFQNDNGAIVVDTQSNLAITGAASIGNPGASWHVVGSADFNGDGQNDLVLQNENGSIVDYLMNGTSVASVNALGSYGGSWHVRGTGDFDGDGKADIVVQNDNGIMGVLTTNGTAVTSISSIGTLPTGWTIAAVADLNGDGHPDILAQNANGALVDYLLNGTSIVGANAFGNPGAGWSVAGTGDTSGDGDADIVLHNDNGSNVLWTTNGSTITSSTLLDNPGATWTGSVAGIDLNGDGHADLEVQSNSGALVGFTINGSGAIIGVAQLAAPAASWRADSSLPMEFISSGTAANNTLAATAGRDEFNFTTYAPGLDAVTNFDVAQDLIALPSAVLANFAAVQAHDAAYQGGTFIALGQSTGLILQGIAPTQLSASDFVFR